MALVPKNHILDIDSFSGKEKWLEGMDRIQKAYDEVTIHGFSVDRVFDGHIIYHVLYSWRNE